MDWRLLQPDKLAPLGLGRGDPARSEDPYETGKLAVVANHRAVAGCEGLTVQ